MDGNQSSELTSGLGVLASAATGNFVGAAIGAVGLGLNIAGTMGQASTAKQEAQISAQNAGLEMNIDNQKRQAMVLSNTRQSMEDYRNAQRARAKNLNSATTDGSQFGSGLQGGQAQASDQSGYNQLGFSQNLTIGQNIFGFNSQIDNNKIALAQLGGQAATQAGISSIGSSISKASGPLGNLAGGISNSVNGSNSGNYSGTPGASNTGGIY